MNSYIKHEGRKHIHMIEVASSQAYITPIGRKHIYITPSGRKLSGRTQGRWRGAGAHPSPYPTSPPNIPVRREGEGVGAIPPGEAIKSKRSSLNAYQTNLMIRQCWHIIGVLFQGKGTEGETT